MSKIEIIVKLMLNFDARYLRMRFLDFSLFLQRGSHIFLLQMKKFYDNYMHL